MLTNNQCRLLLIEFPNYEKPACARPSACSLKIFLATVYCTSSLHVVHPYSVVYSIMYVHTIDDIHVHVGGSRTAVL